MRRRSFWLFHRIHAHQGYFLSRLKTNCALLISKDLRTGAGRRAQVRGQKLCEVLKRLNSKHFEFEVEVPVQLRSGRLITYRWRALGERNEQTGKYHVYLTNAPATMVEIEDTRCTRYDGRLSFCFVRSRSAGVFISCPHEKWSLLSS